MYSGRWTHSLFSLTTYLYILRMKLRKVEISRRYRSEMKDGENMNHQEFQKLREHFRETGERVLRTLERELSIDLSQPLGWRIPSVLSQTGCLKTMESYMFHGTGVHFVGVDFFIDFDFYEGVVQCSDPYKLHSFAQQYPLLYPSLQDCESLVEAFEPFD